MRKCLYVMSLFLLCSLTNGITNGDCIIGETPLISEFGPQFSVSIPEFHAIPISRKKVVPFFEPEGIEIRRLRLRKDGSLELKIIISNCIPRPKN